MLAFRSEGGDWWYAHARLQVTVLTVIVWSLSLGRVYYTYASHVLEQSSRFAVSCMQDALARSGADQYEHRVIWCDCGPHFRSAFFLGSQLVTPLQVQPSMLQRVDVCFFPEHHGKGPVDAHVGRMRGWLHRAAAKHVLSDLTDYCRAFQVQSCP